MKKVLNVGALAVALMLAAGVAIASAQSVTSSDIQRLQDRIYDTDTQISSVRTQNANLASDMRSQLDDLRDEVIYLKVKLRKDGNVSRSEYQDVSDRIDQLASRARSQSQMTGNTSTYGSGSNTTYGSGSSTTYGGGSTTTSGGTTGTTSGSNTTYGGTSSGTAGTYGQTSGSRTGTRSTADENADVPAGTQLDVRLQTPLTTDTATVEQRFEATTAEALRSANGEVLIPAGSMVRGVISDVKKPGRVNRNASLTLSFDQITIRGRNYPIRATVAPFENEGVKGDAAKIGTGAGVGAIIGGILGGFKGAMAGILIGGGGVVAATEGKDVNLPAGTVLRIRLDSGLNLR